MDTKLLAVVGAGVSYLLMFLSGFWMNRSGKPYSGLVLTIHKLISLAAVALLVLAVVRTNELAALSGTVWTAVVVTGLLFVGTIATGGMLSVDRSMPAAVSTAHKITPFLTVISTAVTLFLL